MRQPIAAAPGGVRLTLHVQPRAARTALAGIHGDALKIRIASPPVEGAANRELARFLAELLGVTPSSVQVVAGLGARRKTVLVQGVTVAVAAQRLGLAPL